VPPQARPQSVPANPIHGLHAQQPLPGFQHIQHYQALHQADHLQNVMAQRLQSLQRETQRLQHEMGNIEQRSRVLATANPEMFNNQPGFAQFPFAGMQAAFQPPQLGFRTTQPMPVSVQNLINQQQRERAAEGRHGAQDSTGGTIFGGLPRPTSSGRASPNLHRPDHTTTYTREGIGPNGERWQMTVNETTSTFPIPQPHPLHHYNHQLGTNPANPATEIQATLRNADRLLAGQNVQSFQNLQNSMGGATNQPPPTATAGSTSQAQTTASVSDTPAGIPPPATTNNSSSSSLPLNPTIPLPGSMDPVVYILSSPEGPRALLLNNSDTFYTPRQASRRRQNESAAPVVAQGQGQGQAEAPVGPPEIRNRAAQRLVRRGHRQRQENNPLEPVAAPHGNPAAGALGAQIGPMIWLMIRLAGFVWFFTAGNNSWPRFLMVSALAVAVFIINTGIFNGIAEQLWGPVRRHVEALIPLAGPEAALVPAANAAPIPQQPGPAPPAHEPGVRRRRGELDPAEVAARLLEQRRQADRGWLIAQIRRAEHAALLFLASLVPGVGERHIAAREAAANAANAAEAERQRQTEAAAAAENPEAGSQQAERGNQENQENPPQNAEGVVVPAPAQPPVEV